MLLQPTHGALLLRRSATLLKFVIGICDDEEYAHNKIHQLIEDYSKKRNIQCILIHFYSANEWLEDTREMDCILLDIEMPEIDGIQAAHKFLTKKTSYKIIMLTGHVERFKEAFEIQAFRFVTKPIVEQEIYQALDAVYICQIEKKQILLYRDGIAYHVNQKEIVFIMADCSSSVIYTQNSEYRSELSLKQWEKELDSKIFFRCHKTYIVNLGYIDTIGDIQLKLLTGDKADISRRKRTKLKIAFMEYDTTFR
ncbi:MAG TPA: hypothetical protein DDY31_18725 [Lachnospiraceae bacterium]|nr:hypothetical protein [Lachnospiraceae bacterium]